jgi:hypothetical protein
MMRIKSWIHNRRGSVSIECALGAVVMITASLLALDLYRLASRQATVMHSAVTLADYASRDGELNPTFIERLAEFLHTEQFATADAAFVLSAVRQDAHAATVLWAKAVLLGPDAATDLADCSQVGGQGETATLPAIFTMMPGEVVIVAEVCVEQVMRTSTKVLYAHYILPSRAATVPTLLPDTV